MDNTLKIDESAIKIRRVYDPKLFVDRRPQLELVAEKIRSAFMNNFIASPVVNFWGINGIGKTWLLHKLDDKYRYQVKKGEPTFTLLVTFEEDPATFQIEALVRTLATEVIKQLSSAVLANVKPQLKHAQDKGDVESLVNTLDTLAQNLTPLILFDNTEFVTSSAWEKIEQELLEPLVISNRIIIVIAGRRQIPRWRRFEVRRRVTEYERTRIAPLKKTEITEQLELSHYPYIPVDWLYAYTGGNPYLVDVIARSIREWSTNEGVNEFDVAWLDQHRSELIKILHEAEASQFNRVDEELRVALDAVSPLRFYRLEALRFMLSSDRKEPEVYYLTLLRRLDQETDVVWWNRDRRAYVTSEVVRQIINQRHLLENKEVFAAHHRLACDMYWIWVREYPQASEDFIIEIWFHLGNLYLVEQDFEKLRTETLRALQFAQEKLKSDRLIILANALTQQKGDRELLDLLPEALQTELDKEIKLLSTTEDLETTDQALTVTP